MESPDNYPLLRAAIPERQMEQFDAALALIDRSFEKGEIYNADYRDLRTLLARRIEQAVQEHISKPFYWSGGWADLPEILQQDERRWEIHRMESLNKRLIGLENAIDHPAVKAMRSLMDEVLPLAQKIEMLKTMVIKGRKPSEPSGKQIYSPPLAGAEAQKIVANKLKEITTNVREKQIELLKKHYEKKLAKWREENDGTPRTLPMRMFASDPMTRTALDKVVETRPIGVKPDWEEILFEQARKEIEDLHRSFIWKNVAKLAPIVERKGNLKEATTINVHPGHYTLTGLMRFVFADGSEFFVQNSAVYAVSPRGKPFMRFPTTFHDVVLPNGEKMKHPSEQRMNEVFAIV